MSQYSLTTTDPLRKGVFRPCCVDRDCGTKIHTAGSREKARKIRLPWKADNGVRKQRLYDIGSASLIFDAGTVDTRSSSRANSKKFWSRRRTQDVGDDATTREHAHHIVDNVYLRGITATHRQFSPPAVFGGAISESPPVSRAGTADSAEMSGHMSSELLANSDAPPQSPTLENSQRGWKIPSPLFASSGRARYRQPPGGDCGDSETEQQPATPTIPSALTRMLGVFSRR